MLVIRREAQETSNFIQQKGELASGVDQGVGIKHFTSVYKWNW